MLSPPPRPHLFLYLLTPCNLPVILVEGKPLPEQEKQEHHLLHTDNGDCVCGAWVRSSSVQLPVWGPPRKHRALLSTLLPSHQSSSTLKVLTDQLLVLTCGHLHACTHAISFPLVQTTSYIACKWLVLPISQLRKLRMQRKLTTCSRAQFIHFRDSVSTQFC